MFRLTREVRFAINPVPGDDVAAKPSNSYAGFPSLRGLGAHYSLRLTVSGALDPSSQYLINIKKIDAVLREQAIPLVEAAVRAAFAGARAKPGQLPGPLMNRLLERVQPVLAADLTLEELSLSLSPFLTYSSRPSEHPMVRLSQKFEFSATHRLHNPALSDEENCRTYGKCNNPHGHGHNYEVQVTLKGTPGQTGLLIDVPAFERIVAGTVIDRFDHKNLNVELPEFRDTGLIPSVENISMTIYRLLKPAIAGAGAQLAAVTVWETPKTWSEYSESEYSESPPLSD